jgi:hypothetical protein
MIDLKTLLLKKIGAIYQKKVVYLSIVGNYSIMEIKSFS